MAKEIEKKLRKLYSFYFKKLPNHHDEKDPKNKKKIRFINLINRTNDTRYQQDENKLARGRQGNALRSYLAHEQQDTHHTRNGPMESANELTADA